MSEREATDDPDPKGNRVSLSLEIPERFEELDDITQKNFSKHVYDHKWENALTYLESHDGYSKELVQRALCSGARAFGMWHLADACLQGLVDQVMQTPSVSSPAVWRLREVSEAISSPSARCGTPAAQGEVSRNLQLFRHSRGFDKRSRWSALRNWLKNSDGGWFAVLLWLLILMISTGYALKLVLHMYPDAMEVFLWPIFFARLGGMGAACWTGVMYWTMARGFLSRMHSCVGRNGILLTVLDAHKDLHVISGIALVVFGVLHVCSHLFGTVPGMLTHTVEEINDVLGCANPDTTPDFIDLPLHALQWPQCPLLEKPGSYEEVLFNTMPGLTGVLLCCLLGLMAYTGRQSGRQKNFDIFWYVHSIGVVGWPLLLFFHGSNAWVGIGCPLVIFTSGLPMILYFLDRVCRALRYVLFAGRSVYIVHSTTRPGKDAKVPTKGALTFLKISRPPFLWNFRPGMYAFISMPDYAPLQWHPFTICSGADDETVDFLVSGVGDWTQELTRRCLEAQIGEPFPKVSLDGPYTAVTQSALAKEVLIAIGAGVGISPFLSLMSTVISGLSEGASEGEVARPQRFVQLREVHFYWMARSADEFLFGKQHFTQIFRRSRLRARAILHLHVTGKVPERDASAMLFREAVRRQSEADYKAFSLIPQSPELISKVGTLVPWCWTNGGDEDVMWVSDLIEAPCGMRRKISNLSMTSRRSSVSSCDWVEQLAETYTKVCQTPSTSVCDTLVPIVFGRPNFATEITAIGRAHPGHDVHVYACGNQSMVEDLYTVADFFNNQPAEADLPKQTCHVHFERFG